ncbi:MAG: hypothetical protein Q7J72_00445, partial [Candidatus Omnitrophota bacterium]|nr:hypothetical protein [Candidatus Omnitrophota bacterium]
IPTLTRPWIVPGEIILRESQDNSSKTSQGAYIYKANLKVMLEEDYLTSRGGSRTAPTSALGNQQYEFNDPRLKELNQYSTQLIRELILPKLTQKVNSSKDYANLRQVYFSLILARWFKETFNQPQATSHKPPADIDLAKLIDSHNLTNLTSKQIWDKTTYFNAYQKSFQEGEYNLSEPVYTPTGQVIRRYMSGGIADLMPKLPQISNGYMAKEENIVSSAIEDKVVFTGDEIGTQEQAISNPLQKKQLEEVIPIIESILSKITSEEINNKRYTFKIEEIQKDTAIDGTRKPTKDNSVAEDLNVWSLRDRKIAGLNRLPYVNINYALHFIPGKTTGVDLIKAVSLILEKEGMADKIKKDFEKAIRNATGFSLSNPISAKKPKKAVGSPLVEDEKLADGLKGLNFDLIEKAVEGKEKKLDGNSRQWVVQLKTEIDIAGVDYKIFKVSAYQQTPAGKDDKYYDKRNNVKYRTIELFANEDSNEPVVQIKVYSNGEISAFATETLNDEERTIIIAVTAKFFNPDSKIIMNDLFKKAGLNPEMVKTALDNPRLGWKKKHIKYGEFQGLKEFEGESWERPIDYLYIRNPKSTSLAVILNKIRIIRDIKPEECVINLFNPNAELLSRDSFSVGLYHRWMSRAFNFWSGFSDLLNMDNSYQIQTDIVETVVTALGGSIDPDYIQFRDKLIKALNAAKSSSAIAQLASSASTGTIAGLLEQSKGMINSLIKEIERENSKGNGNQALTSLLTALPIQLKAIDKIAVDAKPENALRVIVEILKDKVSDFNIPLSLRADIHHTTIPALESIIKTIQEQRAGSPIISAVERLQNQLPDDVNEQVLKFIANVNDKGELIYPINKDDSIMIGHVRRDRAKYFARSLQVRGFENLLGYVRFYKNFNGVSILPEEAVGEISNTFFERLSYRGYTSVRISEDEKKEHVGDNANGRNEQPFPGERRVIIPMQKSSKAYVDTPAMKMKEVADAVLAELDGPADFILTNFLSSDMMKHTGNFAAAKKSNEITDQQLGRIKEKIDAIKAETIKKIEVQINGHFPAADGIIYLLRLLNTDYDKFLRVILEKNREAYNAIKSLEQQIPLFVITADHGASEEGLKESPKESNNFHTANPVPYIIYDPLRKQKIPLKEGKTIRNNAATLLQLLGEEIPQEYDESLLPADYHGSKRRIAFAVLDGWGINPDQSYPYDAIRLADTPNYDWFVENASFTTLQAHGAVIGLREILSYEEGTHHLRGLQAGQTDIGHIHLFSGREVKQPLWYVDQLINGGLANGVFNETKEEVKALIRELKKVKETGQKFHYLTIGSEGGVHASLYHMYALMRLAKKVGLEKDQFVIHFGADGRDVPTRTAHLYLRDVYNKIEEIGVGVVSVIFGRDMLVRKEGAENITNRLIDVLSGENLKGDDVTLVGETPQNTTKAGSPLTVEILKKIEWNNIVWNSFKEILEERFKKINEYHGKMFVMNNLLDPLNAAKGDKQKIRIIQYAIAVSITGAADSSEIVKKNLEELRNLLLESLTSYYQKILPEIREAFSNPYFEVFSKTPFTTTVDLENKRRSLLREIADIEAYLGKKEGDIDELSKLKIPWRLNWAVRVYKMVQDKMPLSDILKQTLPSVSSALTGNETLGEYINIINDYATRFETLLNQYFDQSRGPNVDFISRKVMEEVQAKFIAEVSWLRAVPETGILLDVCLKNILEKRPVLSKQGMWISTYENFVNSHQPENTSILKMLEEWRPLLKDMDNKIEGLVKKIQASSSIMDGQETPAKVLGGIDFRQMNMLIQPQGSFASSSLDFSLPALSKAEIESFDLDTELAAIQKLASSGIAPSDERLKEYLAVCFARERTGREIDNLKLCLLDVFEQQQLEAKETPDGYKEVLVIADTRGYVLKEGRLATSRPS